MTNSGCGYGYPVGSNAPGSIDCPINFSSQDELLQHLMGYFSSLSGNESLNESLDEWMDGWMDGRMKVTHCSCCQAQESQSERNCEDSEVRLVWFINIQTESWI